MNMPKTNLGDKLKKNMADKGFTEVVPDTTREDPQFRLTRALVMGGSAMIEDDEKRGQQALAKSCQIPRKLNGDKEEDLTAMGIKLGPNCEDKLFRFAEFPEGWTIKPHINHAMWSDLLDARGLPRATIFYKAAFYDRDAFINVKRSRFSVEVDYEARKNNKVVVQVKVHMPRIDGKDQPQKMLKTFESEKSYDEKKEFREMYAAQDELCSAAWKWVHETYDMSKQWELEV